MLSRTKKFLQSLNLKFPKIELEQDYKSLKEENAVKDFNVCVRFLIITNIFVLIFTGIDKVWVEFYLSVATVSILLILYAIRKFLIRRIQVVTLIIILAYCLSRYFVLPDYYAKLNKGKLFYTGYAIASIQCLLLLRLPNVLYKAIGMIFALIWRFLFISVYLDHESFGMSSFLRQCFIDSFIIYTAYSYEVVYRKVYQNFIQNKEELLKFKEFLAESLPQSLVVITYGSKDTLFSNKAFQNTFESCDSDHHFSTCTLTKGLMKANLQSVIVDLSTIRETGIANSNLVSLPSSNTRSLQEVIDKLSSGNQLDTKIISLAASFKQKDNRRLFEVIIKKVKWDHEDAIAILFNDTTYQENLIALKMSNVNKDQVIATVSHELRTPLNGIIGILDITEKKVNDSEVSGYLSLCKDNAQLLLSLVNSILDLQQISAGKLNLNPTNVEIHNIVNSILRLFNFQCKEKNISLEYEVHNDVPAVICTDENRLKQVLINLIGNAIKFTSKGGIKVQVANHPDNSDTLQISVNDTGIGIKQGDHKHLFKMYSKIEDGKGVNKNGVGLGLTISNALVALLNDELESTGIQVESDYGKGARFYFEIKKNLPEKKQILPAKKHKNSEALRNIVEFSSDFDHETSKPILTKKALTLEAIKHKDYEFEDYQGDEYEDSMLPIELQLKNMSNLSFKGMSSPNSSLCASPTRKLITSEKALFKYTTKRAKKSIKETAELGPTTETIRTELDYHILIVDDNPFNLLVAKSLIQEFGYKIKTALSGQEAIEIVLKSASEKVFFKIIFMDCQMPIMDGFETTKTLRALMRKGEVPRIPIYGWTANNSEEDVKKCFEAGMVGHLPKPATKEDFSKAISKV